MQIGYCKVQDHDEVAWMTLVVRRREMNHDNKNDAVRPKW